MNDVANWYYVGSLGQLGPLTLEQLGELAEGGVIERTTFVWKPGMTDWIQASMVSDLAAIFDTQINYQTPPPSPVAAPAYAQPSSFAQAPVYAQQPPMNSYPVNSVGAYTQPFRAPTSDRSRMAAGVLQLIIPGGGRIYLGYTALGVIQMFFTVATCGIIHIWSVVDGIFILSGKVNLDGYGRRMMD